MAILVTSECSNAAQEEDNPFHLRRWSDLVEDLRRWSDEVDEELRNTKSLWLSAFYTGPCPFVKEWFEYKIREWCAAVWLAVYMRQDVWNFERVHRLTQHCN